MIQYPLLGTYLKYTNSKRYMHLCVHCILFTIAKIWEIKLSVHQLNDWIKMWQINTYTQTHTHTCTHAHTDTMEHDLAIKNEILHLQQQVWNLKALC